MPARRTENTTRLVPLLLALALTACSALPDVRRAEDAPYVLVLGTAQDGGLPQLGCTRPCCAAAREDPRRARLVVSLLLVDPRSGARWLFEATPDLPRQVERARGHGGPADDAPGRPALFDGIFLTHAHMGHYAGLVHLGPEAYGSAATAVYGSARLVEFLRTNGPWSLLEAAGHAEYRAVRPGVPVRLAADLSVTALPVPHRDEFSDTVAWRIDGPSRKVLFLPDIDKWERWELPIEQVLAEVDVAYLDATFFDARELPGRAMSDIPHPFIVESLARLAPLPASERAKVRFIHLNHSNPAADPRSAAAARVRASGMAIAAEQERVSL
jgi:pyrroloquinoline quinone biosynthesis protein B